MSTTVVVVFHAKPGKTTDLIEFLRDNQPKLPAYRGFRSITLFLDQSDPRRIVEIETWASAEDHRAMVEAVSEAGGFDLLDELCEMEPKVSYLSEVTSVAAS